MTQAVCPNCHVMVQLDEPKAAISHFAEVMKTDDVFRSLVESGQIKLVYIQQGSCGCTFSVERWSAK